MNALHITGLSLAGAAAVIGTVQWYLGMVGYKIKVALFGAGAGTLAFDSFADDVYWKGAGYIAVAVFYGALQALFPNRRNGAT